MSLECFQRSNKGFLILLFITYLFVLWNQTSLSRGIESDASAPRQHLRDFPQARGLNRIDRNEGSPKAIDRLKSRQLENGFLVPGRLVSHKSQHHHPGGGIVVGDNRNGQQPPPPPPRQSAAHGGTGSVLDLEQQDDYRQCAYNRPFPRPQHACVVDPITEIPYCQLENVQLDVAKISMASGGEPLETVMGQGEDVEFPKYEKGAFKLLKPLKMAARNRNQFFYIKDVVNNIQVVEGADTFGPCAQRIAGVTLFITRYEYCNAYHAMTDWFNAFLARGDDFHNATTTTTTVVFLDAHPRGKLDPVWSTLWGKVVYAKQLPPGGVCFDHVTLIPPGYSSPLWSRGRKFEGIKHCPRMMEAFMRFFVDGHALQDVKVRQGKVTIIDRIPYVAHPRSNPKKALRLIKNFEELADTLRRVQGVSEVEVVRFEQMTFHEQLKTVRETHVLIGNHGAGISHMLFMHDGTTVMEFQQPASSMFLEFARWKPKIHHFLLPSIDGTIISKSVMTKDVVPAIEKAVAKPLYS